MLTPALQDIRQSQHSRTSRQNSHTSGNHFNCHIICRIFLLQVHHLWTLTGKIQYLEVNHTVHLRYRLSPHPLRFHSWACWLFSVTSFELRVARVKESHKQRELWLQRHSLAGWHWKEFRAVTSLAPVHLAAGWICTGRPPDRACVRFSGWGLAGLSHCRFCRKPNTCCLVTVHQWNG